MTRKRVSEDDRKQQSEQSLPAASSQAAVTAADQRDSGCKPGRGRPRRYETPEAMQLVIDRYFLTAEKPTVSGLALELGFTSREALHNYEGYSQEFADTVKRARLRIEVYYEEKLLDKDFNVSGAIFALKNLGWTDRQKAEDEGPVEIMPPIIYFNADGNAPRPPL